MIMPFDDLKTIRRGLENGDAVGARRVNPKMPLRSDAAFTMTDGGRTRPSHNRQSALNGPAPAGPWQGGAGHFFAAFFWAFRGTTFVPALASMNSRTSGLMLLRQDLPAKMP